MSGFIPKEKLNAYQHWQMPDFDGDDAEPALEDIHSSPARIENALIPKESLTAYERWELAAFDEVKAIPGETIVSPGQFEQASTVSGGVSIDENGLGSPGNVSQMQPSEVPFDTVGGEDFLDAQSQMASAVMLPTAAEIEQMHEDARQQGYQEGYQEGFSTGQNEGSAEVEEKAARLDALLLGLEQSLRTMDQEIAEKLLATAVELASQMVRQSLKIKPELVLPVVREAIGSLNPGVGQPMLLVHPDDAPLIRKSLSEQLAHGNWRLAEDTSITQGGCRVELGAGEVDATFQTRWKRILESIGINQEWLDEKS